MKNYFKNCDGLFRFGVELIFIVAYLYLNILCLFTGLPKLAGILLRKRRERNEKHFGFLSRFYNGTVITLKQSFLQII